MSRVLFVVPPLHGHVNPTVAVAQELADRGATVAWCGHRPFLREVLPDPDAIVPVAGSDDGDLDEVRQRALGLRGAAALKFFFEEVVVPLAHRMVPGVEEAVDRFRPDVVVVDQQTVAGAIVAVRRGLRWATSATTSAELVDPFAAMPGLRQWADGKLLELLAAHEVAGVGADAVRMSPYLVLAFTTPALVGERPWPAQVAFVGPALGGRRQDTTWPWPWKDGPDQPTVLVSLGTVSAEAGQRFFQAVVDASRGAPWRVLLVAPPALVPDPPSNVAVAAQVPQLTVVARVAAVVCHGGHNTVVEALAGGVPLVVAPIRDDQPIVAQQVVDAGAGRRVRFGRVTAAELADVIADVLENPVYQEAAQRVAASFADAGGAVAAAAAILELAAGGRGATTGGAGGQPSVGAALRLG